MFNLLKISPSFLKDIEVAVTKIRNINPVVLSITNYVTMDIVANSLLALGAKPIMSVCLEELEELVAISHVVNLNIGTLDQLFIIRCYKVIEIAKKYSKPLVFDPVGAGASKIRTNLAQELVKDVDVVRGNASEIMSLCSSEISTLGVESLNTTEQAKDIAMLIARKFNVTVVVSGAEDFITDGLREKSLFFGSSLMPLVTGMGCALNSVIASFRAVISDSFNASALATGYFSLCGSLAETKCSSPASFRNIFIDELYLANFNDMGKLKHEN